MPLTVTARVRLVLDIPCQSTWGPDCDFEQVKKQAVEEAVSSLTNEFTSQHTKHSWRLVGEPRVTAVLVSEE